MFAHSTAAALHACYFLLLVAGSHQLSIKEFLVPKYVETGNSAELQCTYTLLSNETEVELFVKWWWTSQTNSGDDRKLIYQRIAGQDAQVVSKANSSITIEMKPLDTIVLTNVSPKNSGTYECEVSNVDELRKHDKLVVYQMGTGPVLNISESQNSTESGEDHTLTIECHALDVAPLPQLTIFIESNNITTTTVIEDHNGVYSIYANATISAEELEPSEIRCEMFYEDRHISHPQYIKSISFVPTGYAVLSTTEAPEEATETAAAPDSLQNSRDDGIRVHSSWLLIVSAAIFTHLLKLNYNS